MEVHFGTYVSCIKIGNMPIIPPLLDERQKEEMRYYRQLAISLENRIRPKGFSSDTGVTTSSSESLPTEKELLRSNPAIEDEQAGIQAVELDHAEFDDSSSDLSHEPSNSFTFAESNFLNTLERSNSFTLAESNISGVRERRNSYTLETPSPVLLDYIRSLQDKQGNNDKSHDIFVNKRTDSEPETPTIADDFSKKESFKENTRRKLWNTDFPISKSSKSATHSVSLPNSSHVSPAKSVKRSYKSDDGLVYYDDYLSNEDREYIEKIELQSSQTDSNTANDITPTKCPAPFNDNDSFVKDFNVLDISDVLSRDTDMGRESIGTFSDCSSVSLNKFIPSLDKKSINCSEAEQEAFLYFKEQLKLKHRQQLASLLLEQQREHDMLKEQFLKISRTTSSVRRSPPSTPSAVFSHDTYTKKSPNKCTLLDDSISIQIPIPNSSSSPKKKTSGASSNYKMHQAACKIQSCVRGYFTRRLFKTNRVVLLVQTIKDCLFTAVSLQNESNLGLSELDLQNRLLQQLTTACNELNDIFSLPVKERMAIIAEDREKKKRESRRTHTPLPLSEATKRSLQRKLTSSAPAGESKRYRKRCKSASSARSDTSNNTPPSQRRPMTATFSYKYSVPQSNRKPWR